MFSIKIKEEKKSSLSQQQKTIFMYLSHCKVKSALTISKTKRDKT